MPGVGRHRPQIDARRYAARMAANVAADLATSKEALASSIAEVARRAHLAPSTVQRVLGGDPGIHLDTLCAVGAAVGLRISVKAYPAVAPSLRDTGQLHAARHLVAQANRALQPALELPVGDPFGRAADLVFFGPSEILLMEVERRLVDFQAAYRAATLKRDALRAQHSRPVRLVLVLPDTRRNRSRLGPHIDLLKEALPATTAAVLRALRDGTPLGRDGLAWVRPWRDGSAPAVRVTDHDSHR